MTPHQFLMIFLSHIFRTPKIYSSLQICPKPITVLRRSSLTPCPIGGFRCPRHETCKTQPPCQNHGEGCPEICISDNSPPCAGFYGRQCPPGLGLRCFDAPHDGCDPQKGGADCEGICLPIEIRGHS